MIMGVSYINSSPGLLLWWRRGFDACVPILIQLPVFGICDFLLEEMAFLHMSDLTAFLKIKSQFTILFEWMNKLKVTYPPIGFQVENLIEKLVEGGFDFVDIYQDR